MDKEFLFVVSIPRQAQAKKFWNSAEHKDKFDVINQYDLVDIDLKKYKGIILSMHIDQYLLLEMKDRIQEFLSEGRKLLFNGHIIKPFMDELGVFEPMSEPNMYDFAVVELGAHPIYRGFKTDELNLRHGVAGFFGRGGNPMPQNAKAILGFRGGEVPCDWEYETSNGGTLYVHSGNDIWMCFEDDDPQGAQAFTNIVEWLEA